MPEQVPVESLQPGDLFDARGTTYLVQGRPETYSALGLVAVPVRAHHGVAYDVEFLAGATVTRIWSARP